MGKDSSIQWTDHTFNPWRGCTRISPGCAHCYAETLSARNPAVLGKWGPSGSRVVAAESAWRQPIAWNRAAWDAVYQFPLEDRQAGKHLATRPRVFCASLSDVFEDWPGPMVDKDGRWLFRCDNCHTRAGEAIWISGEPLKSGRYFECSCGEHAPPLTMADVRARLFRLIDSTPFLDWILLTKRPENIARLWPTGPIVPGQGTAEIPGPGAADWPNLWLGVSVENQDYADRRIPALLEIPAAIRFLSMEPLLGPVDLTRIDLGQKMTGWGEHRVAWDALTGWEHQGKSSTRFAPGEFKRLAHSNPHRRIHWAIVGGESGRKARPFDLVWARSIREQCRAAGVPFFLKQWGSNHVDTDPAPDPAGTVAPVLVGRGDAAFWRWAVRDSHGGDPAEWPEDLRVREFPTPAGQAVAS